LKHAAAWLENTLHYEFADAALLERALTHRSAAGNSNERLEFLGDAVLDFVISHAVFTERPGAPEGDLSRLRASLVKDSTLARLATALGVGEHLQLGSGERKSGGHRRASILADALEAIFGAIFLDGGFDAAESVIRHVYRERLGALPDSESLKDPKTRLQEFLQGAGRGLPEYRIDEVSGQQHRQTFEVVCRVAPPECETRGSGSSRRAAEQAAATAMLARLRGAAGGAGT